MVATATLPTSGRIPRRPPGSATWSSPAAPSNLQNARRAFEQGDFRWVVELVNHLVFADPDNGEAKELQAQALEQLAFGAENATWRNFFLTAAVELRKGVLGSAATIAPEVLSGLSTSQLLDAIAIQIDGPRAGETRIAMRWSLPDTAEEFLLVLENGVLRHRAGRPAEDQVQATMTIERSALNELILGRATPEQLLGSGRMTVDGDAMALGQLLGLLDPPGPAASRSSRPDGAPPGRGPAPGATREADQVVVVADRDGTVRSGIWPPVLGNRRGGKRRRHAPGPPRTCIRCCRARRRTQHRRLARRPCPAHGRERLAPAWALATTALLSAKPALTHNPKILIRFVPPLLRSPCPRALL